MMMRVSFALLAATLFVACAVAMPAPIEAQADGDVEAKLGTLDQAPAAEQAEKKALAGAAAEAGADEETMAEAEAAKEAKEAKDGAAFQKETEEQEIAESSGESAKDAPKDAYHTAEHVQDKVAFTAPSSDVAKPTEPAGNSTHHWQHTGEIDCSSVSCPPLPSCDHRFEIVADAGFHDHHTCCPQHVCKCKAQSELDRLCPAAARCSEYEIEKDAGEHTDTAGCCRRRQCDCRPPEDLAKLCPKPPVCGAYEELAECDDMAHNHCCRPKVCKCRADRTGCPKNPSCPDGTVEEQAGFHDPNTQCCPKLTCIKAPECKVSVPKVTPCCGCPNAKCGKPQCDKENPDSPCGFKCLKTCANTCMSEFRELLRVQKEECEGEELGVKEQLHKWVDVKNHSPQARFLKTEFTQGAHTMREPRVGEQQKMAGAERKIDLALKTSKKSSMSSSSSSSSSSMSSKKSSRVVRSKRSLESDEAAEFSVGADSASRFFPNNVEEEHFDNTEHEFSLPEEQSAYAQQPTRIVEEPAPIAAQPEQQDHVTLASMRLPELGALSQQHGVHGRMRALSSRHYLQSCLSKCEVKCEQMTGDKPFNLFAGEGMGMPAMPAMPAMPMQLGEGELEPLAEQMHELPMHDAAAMEHHEESLFPEHASVHEPLENWQKIDDNLRAEEAQLHQEEKHQEEEHLEEEEHEHHEEEHHEMEHHEEHGEEMHHIEEESAKGNFVHHEADGLLAEHPDEHIASIPEEGTFLHF